VNPRQLFTLLVGSIVACGGAAQGPALQGVGTSMGATVAAPALPLVATPREALLALAKRDHTLAILDPGTLKVVLRLPVGDDPHEVVASADGRFAYVSNYGRGAFHTLAVVDLVHQKVLPAVDLGALRGPHGLATREGKVWFTAEAAKAIGSYDPVSERVDWVLGTGQDRTHMLYVWEDQRRIVASNVSSGTMSILEKKESDAPPPDDPHAPPPSAGPPGGEWEQTVVAVGHGPEGFDVSPDGKEVWVANAKEGTVSVIDMATKAVTQTIEAGVAGANRLKFTPDGKRALISSLHGHDLSVFDAATRQLVKRVPVGHGSAGILMQPDGSRAFVACSPDDYVAVIDLKTLEVTSHLDVGHEPDGLAWAVRP
jgi:YVTN family beta-propeller protein